MKGTQTLPSFRNATRPINKVTQCRVKKDKSKNDLQITIVEKGFKCI
jgi:hypothetical protein